jgi:hypothetical protein
MTSTCAQRFHGNIKILTALSHVASGDMWCSDCTLCTCRRAVHSSISLKMRVSFHAIQLSRVLRQARRSLSCKERCPGCTTCGVDLHLKQAFQSVYRHELETKLSQKLWKQKITKIPDWPRRKTVAEFRLCVGHDCLGTYLHCNGIHPDPYCMLCSLCKPVTEIT